MDSEGKDALEKAQERSRQQGQQRTLMSGLARDARLLAEIHEEEAAKMEKIGAAALNTSKEANDIAWNSIHQQRNASDESRALVQAVQQLEDDVKITQIKASNSLDLAQEAYNNALNLFKDAYSLTLPEIDFVALKVQAKKAKDEADALKLSADNLLTDREQLATFG